MQQSPGQNYGQGPADGLAQQMGQMGLDGGAAPPTRRRKDRHAYHQIEQPAGAPQPFGGAPVGQNHLNGQPTQPFGAPAHGESASAPWQQTAQPWQSHQLPSPSYQSAAQAGAPISMGSAPQHPGGAGMGTQGGVNPEQIPSVPTSRDLPAEYYKSHVYPTMEQRLPPPATTPLVAYDQGNASPKHARLTLNCIPNSQEQLSTTGLPLGLVIQPLAKQTEGESAIPVLDFGELGPPRCRRCRAYVNPFTIFSFGGNRMTCNLCGHPNEVNPEYFAPTDPSGVRVDRQERPELLLGTCEFLVPKEYWSKEPIGMRYLFLIDVSAESCDRGFLKGMCDGILSTLYGEEADSEPEAGEEQNGLSGTHSTKLAPGAKVGFLTYAREIHFYNISSAVSRPQQLVMSDLDDPFAAISPDYLFVDPAESKSNIVSLMNTLPNMFTNIKQGETALLPSLNAALSALSETGGKIICSLCTLPTYGPGRLTMRDQGLQTTSNDHPEQEKVLLRTENQSFRKLSSDLVKAGVGVDYFLMAPHGGYLDIATIGLLSEKSGGDIFYYSNWSYDRDTEKLRKELMHSMQRIQGYAALMKVRCSNGLQIAHYSGNFTQHTFGADLEMGIISEDSAVSVTFSYDGKVGCPLALLLHILWTGTLAEVLFHDYRFHQQARNEVELEG